jgi:hypothetical protein
LMIHERHIRPLEEHHFRLGNAHLSPQKKAKFRNAHL